MSKLDTSAENWYLSSVHRSVVAPYSTGRTQTLEPRLIQPTPGGVATCVTVSRAHVVVICNCPAVGVSKC